MTTSTSGLTVSIAGTYRITHLIAATQSQDPFQQLATSFLSGTYNNPNETLAEAQSTAPTTPNQSESLVATAVGQTLNQFGVNLNNYSLPDASSVSQAAYDSALTQRFQIVQFVGTLFQTLGSVATNADSLSTGKAQSIYVQALNSLASKVQSAENSSSTNTGPTKASDNPIDDLRSTFSSISKDLSGNQSLADFLQTLASNISDGATDSPVGVFVQTSV